MPFQFFHMENPYLQLFDKEMWNNSKYSHWTETRDFEPKQVQYCVLRKHSDESMKISMMGLHDLREDFIDKKKNPEHVDISLQQEFHFLRAQPMDALSAYWNFNRSLDYENFNDCITGQELESFAKFECGKVKDKSLSTSVIFTQAYNPALVLGQNNWITQVKEKQVDVRDLLHDIKLTYFCDNTWDLVSTLHPTIYSRAAD